MLFTEISLRYFLGFCNAVLYREDQDYEYIAIPQRTTRLGNHIFYNSHSQRSPEIDSTVEIVIDGFGDSVLNGGSQLDDDSLATTKLSNYLTKKFGRKTIVLNISSQSWGPDNCYAYLQRHGDFNAKAMLLVMSSHDLYDNMNFEKVVDANPSFPRTQYRFALAELVDRYILPRIARKSKKSANDGLAINKRTVDSKMNTGIVNLFRYARQRGLPFLVYHHADRDEYRRREYNADGVSLDSLCKANGIDVIKELDVDVSDKAYRDIIHFTSVGQQHMFELLKDRIELNEQDYQ